MEWELKKECVVKMIERDGKVKRTVQKKIEISRLESYC